MGDRKQAIGGLDYETCVNPNISAWWEIVTVWSNGNMAQKIESGLYLEGDDTHRFEKCMVDPDGMIPRKGGE